MSRPVVCLDKWYLTRGGQIVDLHAISDSGIFTFPVKGRIRRRTTRGGWVGRFGAWSSRGKSSAAPVFAHEDDLIEVTREEYERSIGRSPQEEQKHAQSKAPKNS